MNKQNSELSITITVYSEMREGIDVRFYLRNLLTNTKDEQIEEAKAIQKAVVDELYYLIGGYGIDKGVIHYGGKCVAQVIFYNHEPRFAEFANSPNWFLHKVKFSIRGVYYSFGTTDKFIRKGAGYLPSFALPCMIIGLEKANECDANNIARPFFVSQHGYLRHDQKDAIYQQFLNRFDETGNLSFGKDRYYMSANRNKSFFEPTIWSCGCFTPKQRRQKRKGGPNIETIKLASKPLPEDIPIFKTSKQAQLPLDGTNYVYIIKMGRHNIYKIGKSNNPQDRLNSLQTANPHKLKLLHAFKADNASAAEEILHHAFYQARMAGEWFKLSDKQRDALLAVSAYADKHFLVDNQPLMVDKLLSLE